MTIKQLAYRGLPQIAVAVEATTPNPGITGVQVWSTSVSTVLVWNGASWQMPPYSSQTANTVFIAPNGANGVPTFRALVAADVPVLDAGKITTGTLPVLRGGTGVTTSTGTGSVVLSTSPSLTTPNIGAATGTSLLATGEVTSAYLGIENISDTTGYGLSLYAGATVGQPTYGMMFAGTATFGTHGVVTSTWATYFTTNTNANRGWIFKNSTGTAGNVAQINNAGAAQFDSTVTGSSFVSTVSTGTAPFTVASTTKVTNLNADLLDGYQVGTSGSTIPLLNTVNTWGNNQVFSGSSGSALVSITNSGAGVGLSVDDITASGTITAGELEAYEGTTMTSAAAPLKVGRSSTQYWAGWGSSSGNFLTSVSSSGNPKSAMLQVTDTVTTNTFTFGLDGGIVTSQPAASWVNAMRQPHLSSKVSVGSSAATLVSGRVASGYFGVSVAGDALYINFITNANYDAVTNSTTSCFKTDISGNVTTAGDLRTRGLLIQPVVPVNNNATVTLTAGSLTNGILTGTPTANINYTLPDGVSMDAAFNALENNMGFEWSIINLATATAYIRIVANATPPGNHTIVGNTDVLKGESGRFLTRKTTTQTFITYRIA